jgi:RimJ/RimL family protein N-acetyltransferase
MNQNEITRIVLTQAELLDINALGYIGCLRGLVPAVPDLIPIVVSAGALDRQERGEDWFWCAPRVFCHIGLGRMVGSACFKGSPCCGEVEIGYGVADEFTGRGFATVGVALMLEEAFCADQIGAVTAETAVENIASQRVLEKNGFKQTGSRIDAEEGCLKQWRRLAGQVHNKLHTR